LAFGAGLLFVSVSLGLSEAAVWTVMTVAWLCAGLTFILVMLRRDGLPR
jgi:hypothetical protein